MSNSEPLPNERKEHLLVVAKTLQECQRVVDHLNLSDVSTAIDSAIVTLQNHVEFQHTLPDDLLKEFGLDDLKDAETWWHKDSDS